MKTLFKNFKLNANLLLLVLATTWLAVGSVSGDLLVRLTGVFGGAFLYAFVFFIKGYNRGVADVNEDAERIMKQLYSMGKSADIESNLDTDAPKA